MLHKILTLVVFIFCLLSLKALPDSKSEIIDSLELEIAKQKNDSVALPTLIKLMEEYRTIDLTKALDYGWKAQRMALKSEKNDELYRVYAAFGICYYYAGSHEKAVEFLLLAMNLAEESDLKLETTSVYNTLAGIYIGLEQYDKSLENFNKALKAAKEFDNDRNAANIYANIGNVYLIKKDAEKALEYFEKALEINKEINNQRGIGQDLNHLAELYDFQGDNEKALEYYHQSLLISKKINDLIIKGNVLQGIISIHLKLKEYNKALDYISVSIENSKKTAAINQLQIIYGYASEAYQGIGNTKKAFEAFKLHVLFKDSVLNKEHMLSIEKMMNKYEIEKVQQEVVLLEKENKVLEQEKSIQTQQKYGWIGGVIALALLALMIFLFLKTRLDKSKLKQQMLNDKIDYSDKEMTNFALHVMQKNELLLSMKKDLKHIVKIESREKQKAIIQELQIKLNNQLGIEKDKKVFKEQMHEIGDKFMMQLGKQYPKLTRNEKRLVSLLRLNFSSKEIAAVLNVSDKSVNMYRWQVRKKFGIARDVDLVDFINSI